jgi:hypothetical protein
MAALVLPIMLPAISICNCTIILGTWIRYSISLGQAITSILIAGMFTVISFGLAKLVGAFKGLSPGEALISAGLMVLILPAMALSIALSSKALSMVDLLVLHNF